MISELGGKVERILIDDLDEGTFYARLVIDAEDAHREIDARPSDCIAIAVRTNAPVHVRKSLFEQVAVESSELEGVSSLDEYLQ